MPKISPKTTAPMIALNAIFRVLQQPLEEHLDVLGVMKSSHRS